MSDGADAARQLLDETRDELTRADGKASLLLASAGVAAGVVFAAALSGDLSPSTIDNRVEWLCWLGFGLVAAGIVALTAAVWPRMGSGKSGRAHYFADVVTFNGDVAALRTAIENDDPIERDISQLAVLSHVVTVKYRWTRRGMAFLASGALLSLIAWAAQIRL